MDFLLNPNIAYLILLGGFLLVMMAIASPGTGLIEIGALFCIALAGYAIYHLPFNWWALILMGLSLVPFFYATQKPKREPFLVLSIIMLIIGSIFLFPRTVVQDGVNPFLAIIASSLVTGFLWIAVRKSLEATSMRPSHDLEGLVGQIGEARTRVNEEGSVLVAGELWSARSDTPIPAGSSIRVLRREGFILIVERTAEVIS